MAHIRPMTADELRELVHWAGDEGWNPGLNDAACFWNLDPEGFLAVEHAGQFVGGGAIIRHADTFGFMGLFIVRKSHRGQRFGTQLWFARRDQLLARLRPGATIGLDGVEAMVPFYEAGGFRQFTRHRRFMTTSLAPGDWQSPEVVELACVDFQSIVDFDRQTFPARRDRFLRDWITQPGAVSLGYVKAGVLHGFGVMRRCLVGWKIGPLFANGIDVADQLLRSFHGAAEGQSIYLDAPDNNPAAIELCRRYMMVEVFGCVRMYYGPAPQLDHEQIFGITTFEVG